METLLIVAKYVLLGTFIFLGATIFTKSVGKLIENAKKDTDDE